MGHFQYDPAMPERKAWNASRNVARAIERSFSSSNASVRNEPSGSGPTKGLIDAAIARWWLGIAREAWLDFVRLAEHGQKVLERSELLFLHGGLDDRLNAVVARDNGRIDALHGSPAR